MSEDVEKVLKQTRLICAAMAMIVVMLAFVLSVLLEDAKPAGLPPVQVAVFVVLGLASVTAGPSVRAWTMQRVAAGIPAAGRPPAGAAGGASADPRTIRLAGMSTAAVTGYAMGEIPLLFGFVSAFMSETWLPFLVGAGVTIAYWAYMFPRRSHWEGWSESLALGLVSTVRATSDPPPPL